MDENKKTVRFVFIGRRFYRNGETGKLNHVYVPLSKVGTLEEMDPHCLQFSHSLGSSKRSVDAIGAIYEGEITTNIKNEITAHNVGNWRYQSTGYGLDQDLRVQLNAQDDTQVAEHSAFLSSKKAKVDNPMYEALAPIREAYKKSNTAGRRAIIAKVLQHIGS